MKQRDFDYQVRQQVILLNPKQTPRKLEPRATEGPFTIIQVHVNGTVTIRQVEFTTERINIRHLRHYRAHILLRFYAITAFLNLFLPRFFIYGFFP